VRTLQKPGFHGPLLPNDPFADDAMKRGDTPPMNV